MRRGDEFRKRETSRLPGPGQTGFWEQWGSVTTPAVIWVLSLYITCDTGHVLESMRFLARTKATPGVVLYEGQASVWAFTKSILLARFVNVES